jgi:crotonobetainyl-CoA:carnitine CoA-transferase CaiB-like acyl-CoA transferase
MPTALLSGLRVLEFSHTIMGPIAGLILADLGADVVKVEPTEGDRTRRHSGVGLGFFATMNRNKRSLALDLKSCEGQAVLRRLIPGTDVLLENYGPGTMERLGCGYEQLAPLNERLIYLVLKGYLAGPYEHRPALDEVVQFHAGLAYMTGPPGRPLRAGASVIDIMGGMFGAIGVLAALRERERTDKGQRVGSALFESAAFLMSTHMAGIAATGQEPLPMPARGRGLWAVYQVFATADDGRLFVGVTSDQQWTRFVKEFGLETLAADPRLATNALRAREREWLTPALQEMFAKLTTAEAMQGCERANISWAPVGKPGDLFTDPHLLASGGLLNVLVPRAGAQEGVTVGLPALPLEFGSPGQRCGLTAQPPQIGEHSRPVLEEAGFTAAEIEALCAQGTVVTSGAERRTPS